MAGKNYIRKKMKLPNGFGSVYRKGSDLMALLKRPECKHVYPKHRE